MKIVFSLLYGKVATNLEKENSGVVATFCY
jgi:hypothetical protein